MEKITNLENGNRITIDISKGYCTDVINIHKYYAQNGKLIKIIRLSIWDDMSFGGYTYIKEEKELEFSFDKNDPLYFCLNRLLGNNQKITIDDDDTYEKMQKYMIIKKENNTIKIVFTNIKKEQENHDKYRVFIKNIVPDSRSKIEDFSIKLRLVNFFKDCRQILLEKEHQITIDEYLEQSRLEEIERNINNNYENKNEKVSYVRKK